MLRAFLHILLIANLASCPLLCSDSPGEHHGCVCVVDWHEEADHAGHEDAADQQECDHDEQGCPNPGDPCEGCDCICSGAIVKQSSVEELADSCHCGHAYLTLCNTAWEPLDWPQSSQDTWSHVSTCNGRQICALFSRFLL